MPEKYAEMKERFEVATKDEVVPGFKPQDPSGVEVSIVLMNGSIVLMNGGCLPLFVTVAVVAIVVGLVAIIVVVVDGIGIVAIVVMVEIFHHIGHASLQQYPWGPSTPRSHTHPRSTADNLSVGRVRHGDRVTDPSTQNFML